MIHKDKIIKLKSEGKSYREIQEILGCSKGTIAYHLGKGQKEKTKYRTRGLRGQIKKYIREYKENSGCIDCKEKYPWYVLEFDHLEDKSFGIGEFGSFTSSLEKVKQEIQKCEVVCSNCHKIRTYSRWGKMNAI